MKVPIPKPARQSVDAARMVSAIGTKVPCQGRPLRPFRRP